MDFNTGIYEFVGRSAGPLNVSAGQSNSILLLMTEDVYIDGGMIYAENGKVGDWIKAEVVDVDNMYGFGANTVLYTYIEKWFIIPNDKTIIQTPYSGKISAGMYLKITYTSTGDTDVSIFGNYRLHRRVS
jgi:hypothetical protein